MNVATVETLPGSGNVAVESALLGSLSVPDSQVFTFDGGLLGFPDARRFALVPTLRDGTFWLQSLDFTALTFLMADPFRFVDGYSLELGPTELGALAPRDPAEVLVLTILTLPRTPEDPATANLQGPVAFHLPERKGRQIVLQDSAFGVRHPLPQIAA